jgi:hypothetical protein
MNKTPNLVKGKNILLNLSSISYIELESEYAEIRNDDGEYVWEKCHKFYDDKCDLKFILVDSERRLYNRYGTPVVSNPYSSKESIELNEIGEGGSYEVYPSLTYKVDGVIVSILCDPVLYEKLTKIS